MTFEEWWKTQDTTGNVMPLFKDIACSAWTAGRDQLIQDLGKFEVKPVQPANQPDGK